MAQYINKDALVAEIEKRLKHNGTRAELDKSAFMVGREKEDEDILTLLATLEVKEVDLEKELDEYTADNFWALKGNNESPYLLDKDDMLKVAKHFYVLGLNKERNKL